MTADRLIRALVRRGWTIGCAESLTGGLLTATLTDMPGSSAAVRGGVVAYATALKASLLDVDEAILSAHGPVHRDVASQMARGARRALGADVGLATTGVAGPAPQGDAAVGTVYVGAATPEGVWTRALALEGDRAAIRRASVRHALALGLAVI